MKTKTIKQSIFQISVLALGLFLSVSCSQTPNIKPDPLVESNILLNQIGTYRHINFYSKNIELHAITFNSSYQAKLLQQATPNQLLAHSLRNIAQENNAIVSVNGGFYTPDFLPVGLFIENNKIIVKPKKVSLLNSCVWLDKKGKVFLDTNFSRCKQAPYAMQSGLVLINSDHINPSIITLQNKSNNLRLYFAPHRRTILAQSSDNKLIVIITSPVTLLDIATLLKDYPQVFGVKGINMALNLDGGSSTGMYVKFTKSYFYFPEIKPVKTLLLFGAQT